jgi:hypothetical protein
MRAGMMAVISLMLLLLPWLIQATSGGKLTGLPLSLPGASEELPPESPGAVEGLTVTQVGTGFEVRAAVRNTDVMAGAGDTEERVWQADSIASLQEVLGTIKALDPKRDRITLVPDAGASAQAVVTWMDAVRGSTQGVLFPKVILQTDGEAP